MNDAFFGYDFEAFEKSMDARRKQGMSREQEETEILHHLPRICAELQTKLEAAERAGFVSGMRSAKVMAGWFEGGPAVQVLEEIDVQTHFAETFGVKDGMPICPANHRKMETAARQTAEEETKP